MSNITLSGLYLYPIKSAAGIAVQTATVEPRGLAYDRRWMVVDEQHRFMTQRKFPKMALIQVALDAETLRLSAPGIDPLHLPLNPPTTEDRTKETQGNDGHALTVDVWGDRCTALSMGSDSQAWLSEVLGTSCQLVYMPDHSNRPTDHGKYGNDYPVSFADAYPFLLISEASLQDLNHRLEQRQAQPVPMNRFRPNLVVTGCDAFAEDTWQQIHIGSLSFTVAKACSRCSIPTVDQATGIRGKEPILTLATYRRWEGQIWFGQNLIQGTVPNTAPNTTTDGQGKQSQQLSVGDRCSVCGLTPPTP